MFISHTSHYADVIELARKRNAQSVSIQNYYTFCLFTTPNDAEKFLHDVESKGMSTAFGVNPNRYPDKYWEVAVRNYGLK